MQSNYYPYSVKDLLLKRYGNDPLTEMKNENPANLFEDDAEDLNILCWTNAYLEALYLYTQNTNRFFHHAELKDDCIAIFSSEYGVFTVHLLFMILEGRDFFSMSGEYYQYLKKEYTSLGYQVKLILGSVRKTYFRDKKFHLQTNCYPLIHTDINGKKGFLYDLKPCWDYYYRTLQYVILQKDRVSYECLFSDNAEISAGEYSQRHVLGKGYEGFLQFIQENPGLTVGYKLISGTNAYIPSLFTDYTELSITVNKENLISEIKVLDRFSKFLPVECDCHDAIPLLHIPKLESITLLNPVSMHGYALELNYESERRYYYIGQFKGRKSPDDIVIDHYLFHPEDANNYHLDQNGDLIFQNGYRILKHRLYYHSYRQMEIEKTGHIIAESDSIQIRSLYLNRSNASQAECYSPAGQLRDKSGDPVSPVSFNRYDDDGIWDEQYSVVSVQSNGKYGIIHNDGTWLHPPIYESIELCSDYSGWDTEDDHIPLEPCAKGTRKDPDEELCCLLTSDGNEVIMEYDFDPDHFYYHRCAFNADEWEGPWPYKGYYEDIENHCTPGKWGFIDEKGEIVIQPKYVYQFGFLNENGNYCVVARMVNDLLKWGVIDRDGNEVIPCIYKELYSPNGKTVVFKREGESLFGIMDFLGNIIIEPVFEYVDAYMPKLGLISAGKGEEELGVYSLQEGKFITECIYDYIDYSRGFIDCERNGFDGKAGDVAFTYSGEPMDYPEFSGYIDNYNTRNGVKVFGNRKLGGLKTDDGAIILDMKYQQDWFRLNEHYIVARESNGSGWGLRDILLDYKGNILISGECKEIYISKNEKRIEMETPDGLEIAEIIVKK